MALHDPTDHDASDAFDDEAERALQSLGIVRVPGMAQDLLSQLAPLLAEEGIDLESGVAPDLDVLNEALGRATERHNMELHTPTGIHRDLSLVVLRRFTELFTAGDEAAAREVLDLLDPDESEDLPAISHVIGTGLGLLDTWSRERTHRQALTALGDAPTVRRSRSARDIVAAARRGGSFASLGPLTIAYGGMELLRGTCISVAAAVRAIARRSRAAVPAACAQLLVDDPVYAPLLERVLTTGADGIGDPGPLSDEDLTVIDSFAQWMEREPLPLIAAPDVRDEVAVFSGIVTMVRAIGGSPLSHDSLGVLADLLLDQTEDGNDEDLADSALAALATIGDYATFRLQDAATEDGEGWRELRSWLTDTLVDRATGDPFTHGEDTATGEKRAAAESATLACSAVGQFLEWLGRGRPVTAAGWLRLADIAPVAAMLGIRAVGTRGTRSTGEGSSGEPSEVDVLQVRSMAEISLLVAWWQALLLTEAIEVTPTRVRPGPTAPAWTGAPSPIPEVTSDFVAACVGQVVCAELGDGPHGLGERVASRALALLGSALWATGDEDEDDLYAEEELREQSELEDILHRVTETGAHVKMEDLCHLGLVTWTGTDYRVPTRLRASVSRGLHFTSAVLHAFRDAGIGEAGAR